VYQDADAFQAHTQTPHLARWRAAAAECLTGPSVALRTNTVFPRDYA
jgi:quinol monooxygenase YgiN